MLVHHNWLNKPHNLPLTVSLGPKDFALNGSSGECYHSQDILVAQCAAYHIKRVHIVGEHRTAIGIDIFAHMLRDHAQRCYASSLHSVTSRLEIIEINYLSELCGVKLLTEISRKRSVVVVDDSDWQGVRQSGLKESQIEQARGHHDSHRSEKIDWIAAYYPELSPHHIYKTFHTSPDHYLTTIAVMPGRSPSTRDVGTALTSNVLASYSPVSLVARQVA